MDHMDIRDYNPIDPDIAQAINSSHQRFLPPGQYQSVFVGSPRILAPSEGEEKSGLPKAKIKAKGNLLTKVKARTKKDKVKDQAKEKANLKAKKNAPPAIYAPAAKGKGKK